MFLTAAVESILDDVISEAVATATDTKVTRVNLNALAKATRSPDMKRVFETFTIATDRVLPRPGNLLLTKKNQQKQKKKKRQTQ